MGDAIGQPHINRALPDPDIRVEQIGVFGQAQPAPGFHMLDKGRVNRFLQRFEPGAGGEHKIARGFTPTLVHSAHWIADPRFRRAVDDYLTRERNGVGGYVDELHERSPFRRSTQDG